jgi:hypothetical protein
VKLGGEQRGVVGFVVGLLNNDLEVTVPKGFAGSKFGPDLLTTAPALYEKNVAHYKKVLLSQCCSTLTPCC